jgi:osmotically-inducible protein OsmY
MSTKKSENANKVQVRITIANVTSDLNFESALSTSEIQSAVNAALKSGDALTLEDIRGRVVLVPADKIGFVEIGEQTDRRVGFGVQ